MFGKWVGDTRQGWVLWAVSAILFVIGLAVVIPAEQTGNPILTSVGANQVVSNTQSGGNMEGKEVRYGITISVAPGGDDDGHFDGYRHELPR